ncbi:hypothetical protein [Arthrobacter crystallopoietes]|uniref:Uncharacterized protein n=1 Tax=Crystallibacter crystallopoietes TaxID=37928 RepID=A0A1H1G336_9MICC|nr:hypothetical protein [Arthrobacter crystallopoietes]AUI52789.1 hypothetical protein AC20117_20320 [Arthrobacter crystallopoietes]SDR07563.1 hypothetical protein SAMN04489742_3811 [Arthrobacter crystallopoietes]
MTTPPSGPAAARTITAVLPPAVVWAVVLILSPVLEYGLGRMAWWGAGAAFLLCFVPWAIVTWLDKRGELRRGIKRLGLGPLMICTGVLMYGTLRAIQWLDGPLGLAAVIFAIYGGFSLLLIFRRFGPDWTCITYGGAAVILILMAGLPGLIGALLLALGVWAQALLQPARAGRFVVSALAGAAVCGGIYALLEQAVP